MKVLTSRQMKEIDRKAIKELGIIGPILMENAGVQIFQAIIERFPEIQEERITIVAGKGNNGGDGFVVARHLLNQGCDPLVLLVGRKSEVRGDAALNLGIAEKIGIRIKEIPTRKVWHSR